MSVVKVTGIATQGRQDANQWVTRYIVSYSPDTTTFRYYREGRGTKVRGDLRVPHYKMRGWGGGGVVQWWAHSPLSNVPEFDSGQVP